MQIRSHSLFIFTWQDVHIRWCSLCRQDGHIPDHTASHGAFCGCPEKQQFRRATTAGGSRAPTKFAGGHSVNYNKLTEPTQINALMVCLTATLCRSNWSRETNSKAHMQLTGQKDIPVYVTCKLSAATSPALKWLCAWRHWNIAAYTWGEVWTRWICFLKSSDYVWVEPVEEQQRGDDK